MILYNNSLLQGCFLEKEAFLKIGQIMASLKIDYIYYLIQSLWDVNKPVYELYAI